MFHARTGSTLLLGLALAASGCARSSPPQRVVLVTIDTLRADHLGIYGDAQARTPNLDGLAREGARFATAISAVPLTLPSHTSILTGRTPPHHGVRHNSIFVLRKDVPTLAESLRARGFATAAFVSAFVLDRQFGLARGFDAYDDRMDLEAAGAGPMSFSERTADHTVDAVLAWLQKAPRDFFLWVHLYDPHAQYAPPPPYSTLFADAPYDGEIAFADAQLGRLLAALRQRYGEGGTLVAVTSDHGEALGEHGEPTHSHGLYDATQHVPLLLAGPGVPRGLVVERPVQLVDLAPTLLDLLGAPPLQGVQGASLVPLLRGEPGEERPAYLETLATQIDMNWSPLLGIRTDRYKYIRAPRPELYDLASDPHELHDLASAQPALVAQLDQRVTSALEGALPVTPILALGADERERLESLGYVVPATLANVEQLGVVGGPDPKDGMEELARVNEISDLWKGHRYAEALERVEGMPSRGYELESLRGSLALRMNRLDLGEESARRGIAMEGARPNAYGLMAEVLALRGDLAGARQHAERARSLAPGLGWPVVLLGQIEELSGDPGEAEKLYREARESRAPEPSATWHLAALWIEQGRTREATRLLTELSPHHLRDEGAATRLAEAELRAGRAEIGLERVAAGLREFPDSPRLLRTQGALLELSGKLLQALASRRRALELDPADPVSQNDVAWNLALLGRDLDRALALAQSAARQLGSAPQLADTLALVRLARGETGRALELAEGTLPNARGEARIGLLLRRAEALARLGQPEAARASLRDALEAAGPQRARWAIQVARVEPLLRGSSG